MPVDQYRFRKVNTCNLDRFNHLSRLAYHQYNIFPPISTSHSSLVTQPPCLIAGLASLSFRYRPYSWTKETGGMTPGTGTGFPPSIESSNNLFTPASSSRYHIRRDIFLNVKTKGFFFVSRYKTRNEDLRSQPSASPDARNAQVYCARRWVRH